MLTALLCRASQVFKASVRGMTLDAAEAFASALEVYRTARDPTSALESLHEAWGCPPLLRLQLVYESTQVVFHPPQEFLRACVMALFDDLADSLTVLPDDLLSACHPDDPAVALTQDGWKGDARFLAARYAPPHTALPSLQPPIRR